MSQPTYNVELVANPDAADEDRVRAGLRAYNDSQSDIMRESRKPGNDWQKLALFVRDADGAIVGGITGQTSTLWQWLEIEYLWLSDSVRGHDYGTQLIHQIEDEARRRGCRYAKVETWSFQAPAFYQKMGYRIVGQLENYPPDATDYRLAKEL